MKITFPSDFWWGTATSGPQTEGWKDKKNKNIMDSWFLKKPNDFYNGVGPNIVNNVYEKFTEDVSMMEDIGLNSYRTSIQWSRLILNFDTLEVDQKAIAFYHSYFQELRNKKIDFIVNLYHFDMPTELQDRGGWENKEIINLYVRYAEKCFELFGDIVEKWATFNEPVVPVEAGYLYKWHYPFISSFSKAVQVAYNTILAHAKVVELFHKKFKKSPKNEICIILNLTPCYSKTTNVRDKEAADICDLIFNKAFIEPCVNGVFPKHLIEILKKENLMPIYSDEELITIKNNKIDFLGVNYYQPKRVKARISKFKGDLLPEKWFEKYSWPNARMNPSRGWEIHPETIYHIANDIKNNYGNIKWFVSENGIGVQNEEKFSNNNVINDYYRINFIKEHLFWLSKAINEGSNCFGYHLWTLVDCWSWNNAFKNRYGIINLNIQNGKRTFKKSALWLQSFIKDKKNYELEIDENNFLKPLF